MPPKFLLARDRHRASQNRIFCPAVRQTKTETIFGAGSISANHGSLDSRVLYSKVTIAFRVPDAASIESLVSIEKVFGSAKTSEISLDSSIDATKHIALGLFPALPHLLNGFPPAFWKALGCFHEIIPYSPDPDGSVAQELSFAKIPFDYAREFAANWQRGWRHWATLTWIPS